MQLCNKVRKEARKEEEKWPQGQCKDIETNIGKNRCRAAYKLVALYARKQRLQI